MKGEDLGAVVAANGFLEAAVYGVKRYSGRGRGAALEIW